MSSVAKLLSVAALAAAPALAVPTSVDARATGCFPYNGASLPSDNSAPSVSLSDWWCPQSAMYGFQGFSYPLEDSNCNAASNGYAQMSADFAKMKRDFGASIVRMYYPTCTQSSVFKNALRAARDNSMGLVMQLWTNFGDGTVWKTSQQAIYDALDDPAYSAWAPYVAHWVEFGSEPVGDGMDGASTQFVTDLGKFRATLNAKGILAGISEDWDRPGTMSSSSGTGLGSVGSGVKANSDFAHIHPMPFYHSNSAESQAWSYIQKQVNWVVQNVGLPTFVTESQWAWGASDHYPGHTDLGVSQYQKYWKAFDDNCEYFQSVNVGWFLHAWRGEGTFDIMYDNGSYVIPNWRPRKCGSGASTPTSTSTSTSSTAASGSTPTSGGSCSWAGHCLGASCSSSDDCADPYACISGICGGSSPASTTSKTSTTPTPTPTSGTCSWAGHCAGASCASGDDCADPYACISGICGGPGAGSSGTCSWAGHCAGASCGSDNDCSDALTCQSGRCA